ncbi:hypothetical protein D3C78_914740 [compost metagenome]
MDFLPEARQACGEQAIGLLRGVLADQLQLAQGLGNFLLGHGRQSIEQGFGAFQAQAAEGHFQTLRRAAQQISGGIGLAQQAEGEGGAVLGQFGDVAQGAATVAKGATDFLMTGSRNGQAHAVEVLDPAVEAAWHGLCG